MKKKRARVMIAAAASGSGKTVAMCALLRLLKRKAAKKEISGVCAFKCGPDFIDPMFHTRALGVPSGNLDTFFLSDEKTKSLFAHYANENAVSLIEGAMGYFDGVSFEAEKGSSADIARVLSCPVVLVINAEGMARSVLAIVKGFLAGDRENLIKGIILNRVSKAVAEKMRNIIEENCAVKVVGYIEKGDDCAFESRHLGLKTPDELDNLDEKLENLADRAEMSIDIDEIIKIAQSAPDLEIENVPFFPNIANQEIQIAFERKKLTKPSVTVGVARDEAFCFYYRENLDSLKNAGANIIFFSPLHDSDFPECDALYLGGGYPEEFSEKLFSNTKMMMMIRNRVRSGLPTIAECGGFLYLLALGVLDGTFFNTHRLCRFGYITVRANHDNLLLSEGETVKAHEFHYFDTTKNGDDCTAEKISGAKWSCITSKPLDLTPSLPPFTQTLNVFAGFPHLFFPSNENIALRFVEAARKYSEEKSKIRTKCSVCPKKRRAMEKK